RWNEALGISSASLKLDLDLGPHTLSAQHNADDAAFGTFSVFDREPGENRAPSRPNRLSQELLLPFAGDIFALEERAQDGSFTKLEWSTVVGQDLAFTARVADQDRRLDRRPLNRRGGASAPHAVPTSFSLVPGPDGEPELQENDFALFNGITDLGEESRDRRQANVAGSWFTRAAGADHEIRFGVDYQETDSDRLLNVGGRPGVDRATGRDIAGQIFLDGDVRPPCVENLDCRPFDTRTGEFQPLVLLNFYSRPRRATRQTTLALYASDAVAFGRWLVSAGLRYERVDGEDQGGRPLVEDGSLSPRIAVKYDPVGDGQTLLSATWSRFVEPFPQRLLDNFGRAEPFSGYTEYVWGGLNEDAAEFCAAQDPNDPTGPCWLPAEVVDFAPIMVAPPNLNLDRSAVEEWVVGFERQLTANTALRLAWVDRNWVDLWDDRLTVDLQNPAGPQLVAVLENLPEAERSYRGIQLLVQKRYAERWQLLAAYTWSETEGNLFQAVGRSSFADFDDVTDLNRTNRLGLAPYDRTHQAKVFANYRQPLGWGDLSFGTSIRFEEGTPYQAEQAEDLGVLFATPRGSLQLEDVFQLDLSLQLDVPLVRGMELEAKLEAFNVTNGRAQVGVETDLGTGRFGQPRTLEDLQEPRAYRLLFGFQF
ncbi:MAG: TonB-dependent receptor, partial [Acidobacteriota bacterium]